MNSLSYVEINTDALEYNLKKIRTLLPSHCKIAAVIKSNAYGHGMIPVACFLEKNNLVEYLAVANDEEALELRKNKVAMPIVVLSYWSEKHLEELIKNNIELGVYSLRQIELINHFCKGKNNSISIVKVHLKIDTGMNRLGINEQDVSVYIKKIKQIPNIKLQGIFSHFAVADENEVFTKKQLLQFQEIVAKIKRQIDIPLIHVANSAGALFIDESCNMMRLGIAMYGLKPLVNNSKFQLQPVLSWKTTVVQVKEVNVGERLSYGLTYEFKEKTKIAVLAIGYGDGYDRKFSNCGEVLIRGKRCPVRGRVCMNLTMVEVDDDVEVGDEVTLIGNDITADELAEKIDTINYEVVTRINSEIERRVVKYKS